MTKEIKPVKCRVSHKCYDCTTVRNIYNLKIFQVWCGNCGKEGLPAKSKNKAIRNWNEGKLDELSEDYPITKNNKLVSVDKALVDYAREQAKPTPDQVNKYLAERMGVEEHNLDYDGMGCYSCSCGFGIDVTDYHSDEFYKVEDELSPHRGIDYHTAPGFFKLLEYMKGRDDFRDFILWCRKKSHGIASSLITLLLPVETIDPTTFPTLCYQWLKGEDENGGC